MACVNLNEVILCEIVPFKYLAKANEASNNDEHDDR